MARGFAESPGITLRSLAAAVIPWLFSSSVHMLAVLVLAVSISWSQSPGGAGGISLDAMFVSTGGGERADTPLATLSSASDAGFYDDERPTPETERSDATQSGGGNHAALASLLNEQPALRETGTLAAGGQMGSGPGDEGIGSANALAAAPHGTRNLRGGAASTGVFGLRGEGNKFLYVFDRSGSMDGHGGTPLAAAKGELLESLQDLGQTHQFQIIFYNEQPRIFNPSGTSGRLVFGTDQNKQLASRFVGSITASGATRHEEALELALRLGPDVIFFLTDADEPRMTARQLAEITQRNKGTMINTIEFGYGQQYDSDNFLVKLARQNGGQHVYVDVSRLPAPRR